MGLVDFLHPGVGIGRLIVIGMILLAQFAIGLLDLLFRSRPVQAKRLVVVFHSGRAVGQLVLGDGGCAPSSTVAVLHGHPLGFQKQLMSCALHNPGCEGSSPRFRTDNGSHSADAIGSTWYATKMPWSLPCITCTCEAVAGSEPRILSIQAQPSKTKGGNGQAGGSEDKWF